jgi:histone deacetylase 6
MIIDWDVHHGEGTQHLFYKRKDVLFLSMHRYDEAKYFPHIK